MADTELTVIERIVDVAVVDRLQVDPVQRVVKVGVINHNVVAVVQRVVEVITVGLQGPPGLSPGGVPADLAGYTHTQSSPSAVWTINHNLGRKPLVSLRTNGNVEFEGSLVHMSNNQVIAFLATAVAGAARCL